MKDWSRLVGLYSEMFEMQAANFTGKYLKSKGGSRVTVLETSPVVLPKEMIAFQKKLERLRPSW